MIRCTARVMEGLRTHAMDEYPYECCGYITGTDDPETWIVRRCRNMQNELHARDPEQYPRDARTAYIFNEEDMKQLFYTDFEDPDKRVVGFYHSHPDHPAYFSEKDRMEALTDWFVPEPFYLVLSVGENSVSDMKAFVWNERTETFDERFCLDNATSHTEGE